MRMSTVGTGTRQLTDQNNRDCCGTAVPMLRVFALSFSVERSTLFRGMRRVSSIRFGFIVKRSGKRSVELAIPQDMH